MIFLIFFHFSVKPSSELAQILKMLITEMRKRKHSVPGKCNLALRGYKLCNSQAEELEDEDGDREKERLEEER